MHYTYYCSRKKPFGKRLTEVCNYGKIETSTRKWTGTRYRERLFHSNSERGI